VQNGSVNPFLLASNTQVGGADQSRDMIEQLPAEYVYTEMFKALDIANKGVISLDDLHMAAQSIGWTKK
jgi:hypothetical protein